MARNVTDHTPNHTYGLSPLLVITACETGNNAGVRYVGQTGLVISKVAGDVDMKRCCQSLCFSDPWWVSQGIGPLGQIG